MRARRSPSGPDSCISETARPARNGFTTAPKGGPAVKAVALTCAISSRGIGRASWGKASTTMRVGRSNRSV